jgi:hypothetical protein
MAELIPSDLAICVREALRDGSVAPWFPQLTPQLVDTAWRRLLDDTGLTWASYGTARLSRLQPNTARQVIVSMDLSPLLGVDGGEIAIELLPDDVGQQYGGQEVRFFSADEIIRFGLVNHVLEALRTLGSVHSLLRSVCNLVRVLHLIDPQNDEVDISFSEPSLPFSAFVSIPGPAADFLELRLAEAILHEAMHLQLTLVEKVVPLLSASPAATFFSPWRNEYRSSHGLLHALYVFRVIYTFLGAGPFAGPSIALYAEKRRETISRQLEEVRDFRQCRDLTIDGASFVERLLG